MFWCYFVEITGVISVFLNLDAANIYEYPIVTKFNAAIRSIYKSIYFFLDTIPLKA